MTPHPQDGPRTSGAARRRHDDYADFDLLIGREAAGYFAHVVTSPAGQGRHAFAMPFTPQELAALPMAAPDAGAARDMGGRLYRAVFGGTVRDLLQRSLHGAESTGAGLRIRLRLAAAPEADAWPWEYLYDAGSERFLCLSSRTPVVRYLDLPAPISPLAIVPPLRLLAVMAAPSGYPPLDAGREWAILREALRPLEQQGLLVLERLEHPTLPTLQRRLRQEAYHILHFVGHGAFDAEAGEGVLIWEDEAGQGQVASSRQLAALLHDERDSLRLVVLNACASARSAASDPFGGAAQSLVQGGIPAVIAARAALDNRTALAFAGDFYAAIADGYPVDAALAEARKAIYAQDGNMSWGTLALYLRAADGRIFAAGQTADDQSTAEEPAMPGKSKPVKIDTGGGAYIGGNVRVGRDFIGRDQTITYTHAAQGATVAGFASLLADLRAALPQAGLDPDTAEVVDADFKVVEAQAQKDEPNNTVIMSKLEGAVKMLTAAAGAATALEKLLPAAQKAVEWAGQLFR